MNNIEQKRAQYDKFVKIGLIGLAALIVSPIIFMVVKGVIGLALAAGIGLIVVNVAPVLSMKVANWKVRAIVAEAKENPIETMVNLLTEKKKAFSAFKESVETAVTAFKGFKHQTNEFSKRYPARAAEFNQQVVAMETLVERKLAALKEARHMLVVGEEKLTEMRAYWDMSQAAQAANKAAGMDTGDLYEKLKADTAVNSVFDSMNQAFAELEVASALAEPMQLTNDPSQSLAQTIDVKSKVIA